MEKITINLMIDGREYTVVFKPESPSKWLLDQSFSFSVIIDDEEKDLSYKMDNEFIRDLYAIMTLDPEKEFINIALEDIKNEIKESYHG